MAWPRPVVLAPFNGGLAVTRALVRHGERVTVLASPSDAFTSNSRGVEGDLLPRLPEGRDTWLERLTAQGDCAVVTGSDLASEFLAEERANLPEAVRTFEGPGRGHLPLMNKQSTYEIAERAGVRYPRSSFVTSEAEMAAAAREMAYPCVMKPALSHVWRSIYGDDRVFLAQSAD